MDAEIEVKFFICMDPEGNYQILGSSKFSEEEIKDVVMTGMHNASIIQFKLTTKPPPKSIDVVV